MKGVGAAVAAAFLAACAPVVAPTAADHVPPRITLTALNGVGTPTFSTSDTSADTMGACTDIQSFPARISVSAADESGVQSVTVTSFPGRIADATAAPATADVRVTRDAAHALDILTVTPRPPGGHVQPNILATLTISELSGVVVDATDTRGNHAELYQVDLRSANSGVICRH